MNKKRYYWLKLKDDFFRQKEIKKLRRIAGGDTYTIIYLKMLLLAMKTDNKIYFDGIEDDFAEELSLELDEDVNNVQMTLAYLQKQQLIEAITDDEFLLPRCKEMVGSESDSAERVRKHRLNAKKEQKLLHSNVDVTNSNTEIEKDKEIDNIYKVIQNKWNNEVALPSIRSMTNSRKGSINARVKEFDEETVLNVIDMVSKSDFLLGKQGDWNNCNFDWVFKPSNFAKILEGNYNKTTTVKEEKKEVFYNPESNFNNINNVEEMRKKLGI